MCRPFIILNFEFVNRSPQPKSYRRYMRVVNTTADISPNFQQFHKKKKKEKRQGYYIGFVANQ